MVEALHSRTMETPLGAMRLVAGERGVRACDFVDAPDRPAHALAANIEAAPPDGPAPATGPSSRGADGPGLDALDQLEHELAAYFAGTLREFHVPLDLHGTIFQRRVWGELLKIPSGKTISYATLARRTGDGHAVRAVGGANGANPVAILVPCHRVIASDGTLGGYGGGVERKRWLLRHEGALGKRLMG